MNNESESASVSNMDHAKGKVEALKNALLKFDKNMDDQIDKPELFAFLDSNMNGRRFDRQLGEKMFSLLDTDKSGKVSVEEFIKTFIHIEEELKNHIKEMQNKYSYELENNNRIKR